jgi:hypothetical protein
MQPINETCAPAADDKNVWGRNNFVASINAGCKQLVMFGENLIRIVEASPTIFPEYSILYQIYG